MMLPAAGSGSLGSGSRAEQGTAGQGGGGLLARSGDDLIKSRVHFPAQLSPRTLQARNEYSPSANRRKFFIETEPEGVKGKQALFTRRQRIRSAQPEEAEARLHRRRESLQRAAAAQGRWSRGSFPAGSAPLGQLGDQGSGHRIVLCSTPGAGGWPKLLLLLGTLVLATSGNPSLLWQGQGTLSLGPQMPSP